MCLKSSLESLLHKSVVALQQQGDCAADAVQHIRVERTRDSQHGDFATNIALVLAKSTNLRPPALAQRIIAGLPPSELLAKAEVAGPGFINFHLNPIAYWQVLKAIRAAAARYGHSDVGAGKSVLLEFVSANPTGPLHVGHGRGAAYGDTMARLLRAVGYQTHCEYYVNDAGRQMDTLALSVWLRYRQQLGETLAFPCNGYQGDYVSQIAHTLRDQYGARLQGAGHPPHELVADLPSDAPSDTPSDTEAHLDALIAHCKAALGETKYQQLFDCGREHLVAEIREDLAEFGVEFDAWFSERTLLDSGEIDAAIERLRERGCIYTRDGALWFRASDFGDEKDRVVRRANGLHTYFAADMAYHYHKGRRGFDKLLNVFGADHHGYVKRIQAAFTAFGVPGQLEIKLVQFAVLYRGQQKVSMSTRGGDFVTLRALRAEVGNAAARFFYVLRKPEQHIEFDLDLAKSQSADNPVYYIQYAHARVCSVFRQLQQKGLPTPHDVADRAVDYTLLTEAREQQLLRALSRFPEVVEAAAEAFEPHQVAYYLRDLATHFHAYYNAHPFIANAADLRLARLGLIDATRQVLANGLQLLGLSAPESM